MFQFNFAGGVKQLGNTATCKLIVYHVSMGKEISFYEARKMGIVKHPQNYDSHMSPNLYEVGSPILKVFLSDIEFGKPKITYSFYMHLGDLASPQTVEIKPMYRAGVGAGLFFKAQARFLNNAEVETILDKESVSYKMFRVQQRPSIDILKQLITITRPKVVTEALKVRKLRIS